MLIIAEISPVSKSRFIVFIYVLITALFQLAHSMSQDHCYSDIGCFPWSREFFHPRYRPFNVRPWHRRHIKTQFELFNRYQPEGYMLVPWNRFNLQHSHFDPMLETKVIIPGWLDNINRTVWVKKLRDALLWMWAPVNIIVVRWRNFTPYTIATANTRVVGAELANLIKFLEHDLQYDRAYYHIIGHSLGAHIGGYAGDRVPGLGRITALDPARPFFQGMPKSVRLDRGDAKFVDAIHSDFTPENAIFLFMSYGMTTPVGHLDFYPNGPPLFQPGCLRDTLTSVQDGIAKGLQHNSLSIAFLEASRYLTACDHQRSHEWFIESITNRGCLFVGVRCNEFEGMINGRCTCDDSRSACAIMGIHADQMYLSGVHDDVWPIRGGSAAVTSQYKARNIRTRTPIDNVPNHHQSFVPVMPLENSLPMRHPQQPQYSVDGSTVAQQMDLEVPHIPEYFGNSADELNQYVAAAAQMGTHAPAPNAHSTNGRATREQIYAKLKQQIEDLGSRPEPMIHGLTRAALNTSASAPGHNNGTDTASYPDRDLKNEASEQHGSTMPADPTEYYHNLPDQHLKTALEDVAFVQYLRDNLFPASESIQDRNDVDGLLKRNAISDQNSTTNIERSAKGNQMRRQSLGQPVQYTGHPYLMSNMHRDSENWYEGTSKWFLKTNNRPNYCSNQYQLMVFFGPLDTINGRDSLRANLIVSLIGSRGQLLNQRFIPRGSTLSSFTMQPFFILLEGSYTLGQIQSVAIAWEARNDPDPIQATVTFQSNPALETVQSKVPTYQIKNNPWIPETMKYDKSHAFQWTRQPLIRRKRATTVQLGRPKQQRSKTDLSPSVPIVASTKRPNLNDFSSYEERHHKSFSGLEKRMSSLDYADLLPGSGSLADFDYADDYDSDSASESSQTRDDPLQVAASDQVDMHNRDQHRQKEYIADDDGGAMLVPLVNPTPEDQLVPVNQLHVDDVLQHLDPQTMLHLHNTDLFTKNNEVTENTIVINQVIVSPIQATYGRYGRNAKAFCAPGGLGQRLSREQSIRLAPTLLGRCHMSQLPIQVK